MSYRTGTKVTRNLYEGDRLVGQCQTDEDALRIVAADGENERLRAALMSIQRALEAAPVHDCDPAHCTVCLACCTAIDALERKS